MGRYEDLIDRISTGATNATTRFEVDQMDHLVRHANILPNRFYDEVVKHMRSKVKRDIDNLLRDQKIPDRLTQVDIAEKLAWDRRARLASTKVLNSTEMPVRLDQLSIEQLVNCRLLQAREQWLTELNEQEGNANQQIQQFSTLLEEKRGIAAEKLKKADELLNRLQSARSMLQKQESIQEPVPVEDGEDSLEKP